jgi:hypothetical protein
MHSLILYQSFSATSRSLVKLPITQLHLLPANIVSSVMSQRLTTKSRPDYEFTTTSTTTTQIICSYNDTYEAVIRRFRFLVPEVDVSRIRTATNACDIKRAIEDTGSPSGFVLFADYNHAGWMRHFTTPEAPIRRAQRFTYTTM